MLGWIQSDAPSRGRPPRLSRERIVAAALEFDLESLTMRGLAERLGVTHSTLYGWVSSREELLDLISAVTVDKTLPEGDPVDGDWRGWLTTVAVRMHAELMSAPRHASRLAVTQAHRDAAHDRLHSRAITALAARRPDPRAGPPNLVYLRRHRPGLDSCRTRPGAIRTTSQRDPTARL